MSIIDCKCITKRFQNIVALDDVSFSVREGKITGFIGPNGAGKTTTIKILMYLLGKDNGEVKLFSKTLNYDNAYSIKSQMGYVGSNTNIFQHYTLREFWWFVCTIFKIQKDEIQTRIKDLAQWMELYDSLDKKLSEFSSGMLKKAHIGSAIIHNPKLLILDEPFEGVDPTARKKIKELLKDLSQKKTSIFISSHDMLLVDDICEDIIFINKGKIIFNGEIKSLVKKYKGKDLEDIFISLTDSDKNNGDLKWL